MSGGGVPQAGVRRVCSWFLLSVGLLSGCAASPSGRAPELTRQAPSALFERVWQDERGTPVTFDEWRGSPLIVTMFFRTCRSRCPVTIHKLVRVAGEFRKLGRGAHFVLVTLDPLQDTPALLATFKREQGLDPASFHLLSGELAQTRELARFLRVRAAYDDFHIDHEVRIAVFDARGTLVRNLQGWTFPDDEPARATSPNASTQRVPQ